MELETLGYCIVIAKRSRNEYEALGYGVDGAPYDTELLRDRGAAVFDTKKAAKDEIKAICDNPENKWAGDFSFGLPAIHRPASL